MSAALSEKEVSDLSTTLRVEMGELKALAKQADARRAELRAEEDAAKKQECADQKALLQKLITAQLDAELAKTSRDKTLTKIFGAVLTVVLGGGSTVGYFALQAPSAEQAKKEAAPVIEAANAGDAAVEVRLGKQEQKTEILKEMALESIVQVSDDGKYTRDLIRAGATERELKKLEAVAVPTTIAPAAAKSKAIKKAKQDKAEKLFDAEKSVDPFEGL